ncbi:MAG: tol-pal system protein YbgF [Aliishimia sp.]
MRNLICATAFVLITGLPVVAQDKAQSLADIRQELTVLYGQVRTLGQELNTTGAPTGTTSAGSALDRLNAIESELQRLTAKTEDLEFRVNRVVRDGTNQIGDLEFRLCELEDACDIGALGDTPTLGGGDVETVVAPTPTTPVDSGPELAIGEKADFERAQEALASGDFRSAAEQFAAFITAYPGSPLTASAELGKGEGLEGSGDIREAARSYLAAFSSDQTASTAPHALYHLGAALGRLGQTSEACVTLGEVEIRYPGADAVLEAQSQMRNIGCS